MSSSLLGLPAALRAAGLAVYEVPGWQNRSAGSHGPWLGVLNHHTAGPLSSSTLTPSLNICIHGRSDLSGPLCNLYGGRDRKVYVVAAGRANHAGSGSLPGVASGNGSLVGIEWENSGTGEPWDNLLPTMTATNGVICKYLGVPTSHVWDHKEWTTRKIDRHGVDPATFRRLVAGWNPQTTPPIEGLSVSDIAAILAKLDDIHLAVNGLRSEESGRYVVYTGRDKAHGDRDAGIGTAVASVGSDVEALRLTVVAAAKAAEAAATAAALAAKLAESR